MNKLSVTALVIGSGLALAGTVMAGADWHAGKGAGRMSQLDANKDGKVSLAELIASKQSWLREMDGNKDGVVTRAEIETSLQARRTDHINKLFAEQDTNKDGSISREESRMPARWFARIDANSDGKLTREELSREPGHPGAREGERGGMFSKLDTNGDGSLDASELSPRGWHGRPGPKGHGGSSQGPAGTQPS